MANSSIISKMKDKVVTEIVNDEALFHAINPPDIKSFDDAADMIGTHIFRYHQNPEVLDKTITFLTIQMQMPNTYGKNHTWVAPNLEIWIISHVKCMDVNNIPKITANRNDYIAQLLDEKFNGRSSIGVSKKTKNNLNLFEKMNLIRNVEGAYAPDYLYRQLIFELKDLNDSPCDIEE